jgi:hypothetical protein
MAHDNYTRERKQWDRLLGALERAARQLDRVGAPLPRLRTVFDQIRALEEQALDDTESADGERPFLADCVADHDAVRKRLDVMGASLTALEAAARVSARQFADAAADFIRLRREHLGADERVIDSMAPPARHRPAATE